MLVIRFAELAETAWKNGGGTTTEIAVSPEGAGFATFDWRLSVARVAGDGPFSNFPQIDRTLTLIEGNGMRLVIDGGEAIELTTTSAPLAFPGDVPVTADLIDGPIRDLNVMTRRGRYRHQVQRVNGETLVASAPITLVVALGEVRLGDVQLGFGDTAQVEGSTAVPLSGKALVIGLQRLA